ncbi:hypothetical protein KAT36_00980 [Candidatus Pacearchaeota archaeon]|nr:hypothetical protein [Candidatus Pacearchaeota archaeon]
MRQVVLDIEKEAPIGIVGGKARGMFILKSLEEKLNEEVDDGEKVIIPRFFVVPSSLSLSNNHKRLLATADSLFYGGKEYGERYPIETGEKVRVVSDGEKGLVFNLSR